MKNFLCLRPCFALAAIGLSLVSLPTVAVAQGDSLLENFSFESSLDGWTHEGPEVVVLAAAAIHGIYEVHFNRGVPAGATLRQTVTVEPGKMCEIQFLAGGISKRSDTPETMRFRVEVRENGSVIWSAGPTFNLAGNIVWEEFEGTFTPTANSVEVSFTDTSPDGDFAELILDAVRLTQPDTYAIWAQARGVGGEDADDDSDGFTNFTEYFFGMDPLVTDSNPPMWSERSARYFGVGFERAANITGYDYQIQHSTDLQQWQPIDDALISESDVQNGSVIVRGLRRMEPGQDAFYRVQVEPAATGS